MPSQGWNTQSNGSGTTYTQGQVKMGIANVTLYAVWTHTYNVTYDPDGAPAEVFRSMRN